MNIVNREQKRFFYFTVAYKQLNGTHLFTLRVYLRIKVLSPMLKAKRRGWRGGKISAFQPQNPEFKSGRCRLLNICVTFFSAKADSTFHPYRVRKMSTSFCWGLTCDGSVPCPGGINDSHLLNTTEIRDKHRLQ